MLGSLREAGIFQVEDNGPESCVLSPNSSFVLVRVPVRIEGEGQSSEATFSYSIGSRAGRKTTLPLQEGFQTILRFRIPLELFRDRERLSAQILASSPSGTEKVLWAKRWEVSWQGQTPALEPIAD